jgi:hypothetical protein
MQEFINPKSMLTPGAAGAVVMFLVNGIAFSFPEIPSRYIALFLSFLIGAVLIWFSETTERRSILKKALYWVLNSLVIFVVGFGTTNLAADVTEGRLKAGINQAQLFPFVSSAFAENDSAKVPQATDDLSQNQRDIPKASDPQNIEYLNEQLMRERVENERLKKQIESMKEEKVTPTQPENHGKFFKRW